MNILQADGYDLYEYVVSDKILKKKRFSFGRVKSGLWYLCNAGRIIEFKNSFKIKNKHMKLQRVVSKKYIGKIDEVTNG